MRRTKRMSGRRFPFSTAAALAILLAGVVPCAAQSTTVSNTGPWNGIDAIDTFGVPADATFGQTFTPPAGMNSLSSFAFYVDDNMNPDPVTFRGYVMAWDGVKASGPVLYQSDVITTTDNRGAGGFERINVTISQGITLVPGATYVAFFSASGLFGGMTGDARFGADIGGAYPGGGFVSLDNGDDFSLITTNNWDPTFIVLDLIFEFVFAVDDGASGAPVILVDQAAMASLLFSSVPTALAQRELALGASRTALRDFNGRLFRRRAGAGRGVVQATTGGKSAKVVHPACQPAEKRWEVFTSFDYGNLNMDASRNFLGVESNTYAESIGVERAVTRHLLMGGGLSYLESDADRGTDVAGMTLAAYVSGVWGGLHADLLYGATLLEHQIDRDTGFGGIAHARPDSVTHTVSFNTGYNFHPGQWSLGPIAGLDWAHAKIDGYSESGGGTAATRVSEQTVDSLLTRAGLQASRRIGCSWGAITPQVRVGWERENLGSDDDLTAALLRSPYYRVQGRSIRRTGTGYEVTVPGQDRARDSMSVGAGVLMEIGDQLRLLLDYEGNFLGDGYAAHYGKASLGWKF